MGYKYMKTFFKIIFITFIALIVIGIIFNDTEEKNLQKIEVLITLLTNNLKSQLAYCTFGCLKKLATF